MAEAVTLSVQQKMALMTMESQAKQKTSLDIFREFDSMGLPSEVITVMQEIAKKTARDVTGKVIEVGKIIVTKIIEFIKQNPALVLGAAIGAAVGALAVFIPFIGSFIAPLTTVLGAAFGAIIGNHIGKSATLYEAMDDLEHHQLATITTNAVEVAKKFFNLLKEIFLAIFKPEALQ